MYRNHMNKLIYRSYVVVSHKYTSGPDDDLVEYLNRRKVPNVLHITHSFSSRVDRCSSFSWYKNGLLVQSGVSHDYNRLPELFIYLKELIYTHYYVKKTKVQYDVYVGLDGLCFLFWSAMGWLYKGPIKKIFWAIDFVPNDRFQSSLKYYI